MPANVTVRYNNPANPISAAAKGAYDYAAELYLAASTYGLWMPQADKVSIDENGKVAELRPMGNGQVLTSIFDDCRPPYTAAADAPDGLPSMAFLRQTGVRGNRFDEGDGATGVTLPVGADFTLILVIRSDPLGADGSNFLWMTNGGNTAGNVRLTRGRNGNNGEGIGWACGPNASLASATWANIPTGVPMAIFAQWRNSEKEVALSINGYAPNRNVNADAFCDQTASSIGSTLGGFSNEGYTGEILAAGVDTTALLEAANADKYAVWKQRIRDRFTYLKTRLI